MKDILILGVESSCDETSVAIVKNGRDVLSNVINSQIDIHKVYGGVVPEIASRNHIKVITYVVEEALQKANVKFADIDAVACTYGPRISWNYTCRAVFCEGTSVCTKQTAYRS